MACTGAVRRWVCDQILLCPGGMCAEWDYEGSASKESGCIEPQGRDRWDRPAGDENQTEGKGPRPAWPTPWQQDSSWWQDPMALSAGATLWVDVASPTSLHPEMGETSKKPALWMYQMECYEAGQCGLDGARTMWRFNIDDGTWEIPGKHSQSGIAVEPGSRDSRPVSWVDDSTVDAFGDGTSARHQYLFLYGGGVGCVMNTCPEKRRNDSQPCICKQDEEGTLSDLWRYDTLKPVRASCHSCLRSSNASGPPCTAWYHIGIA
jgi:hypothetical protein